jgi:DNA-binding transcriptional LysR family regulator
MLDSRRLRHFLAIYELGSIGQAAERLLLTQPALSKSIRQLEDQLGVRLFDRTTQGVVPTVFGESLALHAKSIEAQIRQAEAAIQGMQGRAKGHVRIGVGPVVAVQIMPAAALMIRRLHPDLELTVTEGLVDELIPALRRQELDVAVGAWPRVNDPIFTTEVLLTDTISVAARDDHPLVGQRVTLLDLVAQNWVLPPATQRWRQLFETAFVDQGLSPPTPTVTSNSAVFLKAMLASSDAISFLPCQLIAGTRGLTTINVDGLPNFAPEIAMTFRERSLSDPARMEVVQALRAVAAEIVAHG